MSVLDERSVKFYLLALCFLLVSLWIEGLTNALAEGFILAAIALVIWALYSSTTKASLEVWWVHTSLAYVCSVLIVTTFFIPVASWTLTRAMFPTLITPLKSLFVGFHVLGSLISFYAGRCAKDEWFDYQKEIEQDLRPKDSGLAIS